MNNSVLKTIMYVSIFAVAMGFLESSVVVYLRALYYPAGFIFPLKTIAPEIAITEIIREFATLIMLVITGVMAGKTKTEKFAYFIYSFAVWDIFYYVFLKVILNWPESIFTWDILFLIPTTWVGPVIAPVINSITMILLALILIKNTSIDNSVHINKFEWSLLIIGSLIVIHTYTIEYSNFITEKFSWTDIFSSVNKSEVLKYASTYVPKIFNWLLFSFGVLLHFTAIGMLHFRIKKNNPKHLSS